jgi:hypothetical protein
VPKLLAGLAYPPLSMAPASVPGSNMEAVVSLPANGFNSIAASCHPRLHEGQHKE